MAYSAAIFFLDYEDGSDAARTALTACTASNPSGSITRINKTAHGLVADAIVDLTLFTAWLNDAWKVSIVDANNFDLVGAVWQATADPSGTATPRGGSSKADAWKTQTLGATAARIQPGDTMRSKASPDPTSLGVTGVWTDGPQPATQAITSSTNASPIVVTQAGHGRVTGQTVVINAHTVNTRANGVWKLGATTANTYELLNADGSNSTGNGVGGATGTSRVIDSLRVLLSAALTQNIACHGNQGAVTAWTASANVTTSISTADNKEGGECVSIAIAAGFTTGLAAYSATGTLNLSGYQQLSLKVKQTAGTLGAAGSTRIRLCSDTAGVTTVDSFDLPAQVALNQWVGFTIDKGSALGASIQSIAFDAVTDNGAQTFLLDNIIAVKASSAADSLSLTSLIGKNTSGETWCGIASINGTRVMLDAHVNSRPTTTTALPRGYTGTTETVTTYKRETIKTIMAATSNAAVQGPTESGTEPLHFFYSGGWNRTDMTTQTGETWFDGQNGFGYGMNWQLFHFIEVDKIKTVRYDTGARPLMCAGTKITDFDGNNCTTSGAGLEQQTGLQFDGIACFNGTNGVSGTLDNCRSFNLVAHGNVTAKGAYWQARSSEAQSIVAKNNGAAGLDFGSGDNSVVRGLVTAGNATAGVASGHANGVGGGRRHVLIGALISEALEFRTESYSFAARSNVRFISKDHQGVAGFVHIRTDGGSIESETTVRHTASGRAWAIDVTSLDRTSSYPIDLELVPVAVEANALVTVSAWMRRTGGGSGIVGRLVCKGGQIAGVAADVTASIVGTDAYELVTITFTPTEAGVVMITAEAYGGTTGTVYVDDLAVGQA